MLFSIGNIITLLIVLIILALYRQLDKNNRSLDKVRRYTEKVTSDLDAFVDHKTQDMKNLAIEIDVHEKTGKEVLKRIAVIEGGISTRAEDVKSINDRIQEYDKAIKELAGMTGKVDENLQRLHQESEFVDKVGRRLKDSQNRMVQIEKNIPALTAGFSAKNEKEFEKLRIELMSGVERQAATVIDNVTASADRVEEFTSHLNTLEARRDSAAAETLELIKKKLETAVEDADEQLQQLNSDFSVSLDSVMVSSEKKKDQLSSQLISSEQNFRTHVNEIGEVLNDKLVSFKDSINSLEEGYQQNLKDAAGKAKLLEDDVFDSLKSYIEERSRATRKQIDSALEDLKKSSAGYRSEIDASFGESQSEITVWRTKLSKDLDDRTISIRKRFDDFESGMNERLSTLTPETDARLEEIEENYSRLITETSERLDEKFESRFKDLDVSIDTFREHQAQTLSDITESADKAVNETRDDVFKRIDEMIAVVNDKETQLSEFEENLAYKLTRIEEITADIDLLENNLKQMVDRSVEDVNSNFDDIKDEMAAAWQRSNDSLNDDIHTTRQVMTELEAELEALKAAAYTNVSEKLKDFEDGFFGDLKDKSGQMEKQLVEWEQSVEEQLVRITQSSVTGREELENNYSDELNIKVVNIREKTSAEFVKYESQVDDYQSIINEKLGNIDVSIEGTKAEMKVQVSEANTELENYLKSELEKSRASLETEIGRFSREADVSLREIEDHVKNDRIRIQELLEAQTNELELWQSRLRQQLAESENGIQEQYSLMKSETAEKLADVREAMSAQRGDFDSLSGDVQRRSRELQNELDQQIKDFEVKSDEIVEGFTLANKRMYEKLDEQNRELSFTLSEIEKQQKSFIAQTRIFERADSMKESLENGVEELKSEVTRITVQASEIREAEKKFLLIKKQAEEISAKMTKFASDRRKVEELEDDFKRVMNISQSVDMKLNQVTAADDSIQLVQARLKELDGLQKEVEGRYERLQKKETIVDSTIDGVDRSFKQLNDLDHLISVIEDRSTPMSDRLDELTRRIDFLSKNKKQIDTAISHIENIDTTLLDLEDRIDRMQKAREWLAGTETRLEEVNKQAQEQVKLLHTLVKESSSKAKSSGAPPMEIRDVVIKLAHQGWTVEQIARSTKLARGEVELILELQPKK
jgi:chromosome segregation ATPase